MTITPEAFRDQFPVFDSKVFLNSCSKGALSRDVERAYHDYLDSWRNEGSPWEEWVALLERTRTRMAAYLGCDTDEQRSRAATTRRGDRPGPGQLEPARCRRLR